jgi:hypothetical protein
MKRALLFFIVTLMLAIAGCGGGGGGGGGPTGQTVTGRVLNVITTSAPNPQAQIQVGSTTALTDATDGSFTIKVPVGTTSLLVDTRSTLGVFTFTIPSVTGTTDVGDLYVGPEKIVVTGKVIDSTNSAPIVGATVSFAGRTGTTDASGIYTLNDVAYSSTSTTGFQGITGSVQASGYFANTFSANGLTATAGSVTFDDILLVPGSDSNPPPGPFTIFGKVGPTALAVNASVTVFDGTTAIAHTTSGTDGLFYVWVAPGTYTLKVENGTHSFTSTAFALDSGVILRKDVTLP